MKKTMNKALKMCLTTVLLTSTMTWTTGQTVTNQNEKVSCTKTSYAVNFANCNETKNKFVSGKSSIPTANHNNFTFTGKGSWSDAANWENNKVPPAILKEGDHVVIDGRGPCLYNSMAFFKATKRSTIEIKPGKQLYVSNGNTFQVKNGTLNNNGTLSVISGTFEAPKKETSSNSSRGKITTTKFSNVKGLEADIETPAASEKASDVLQNSNKSVSYNVDPTLLKPVSK